MELKEYKLKHRNESFNKIEVVNTRGTKDLIELLSFRVFLNGEVKTLKDVLLYIYENNRLYTETKYNELENRIKLLEEKLSTFISTQTSINENLVETFKDGGVI